MFGPCVSCAAARRWMTENRVRFDECSIERDAQCKAHYDATLARGTPTLLVRDRAGRFVGALHCEGIVERRAHVEQRRPRQCRANGYAQQGSSAHQY